MGNCDNCCCSRLRSLKYKNQTWHETSYTCMYVIPYFIFWKGFRSVDMRVTFNVGKGKFSILLILGMKNFIKFLTCLGDHKVCVIACILLINFQMNSRQLASLLNLCCLPWILSQFSHKIIFYELIRCILWEGVFNVMLWEKGGF